MANARNLIEMVLRKSRLNLLLQKWVRTVNWVWIETKYT